MVRTVGIVAALALAVGFTLGAWGLDAATGSRQDLAPAASAQPAAPVAAPLPSEPPEQQPRLFGGDLRFLGSFALPETDGREGLLHYGGHALGLAADGQSLYYSCIYGTSVARVSLPEVGGVARVLEPCQPLQNIDALDPSASTGMSIGGVLAWNGRLILSGYSTYDAAHNVTKSHWAGESLPSLAGPFTLGNELPGLVGGYMGVVPEDWRALIGGPALTGQCCISIISRSSFGPSVSVFDPADVGVKKKVPAKMLVGYPDDRQNLGPYDRANEYFSGASKVGGVVFPSGTRSVLFIGRHGGDFCYGEGTKDASLHQQPHPAGTYWCYDPTSSDKGTHGFPYRHMVWAYDAVDLAAVRRGKKSPWDLRPVLDVDADRDERGHRRSDDERRRVRPPAPAHLHRAEERRRGVRLRRRDGVQGGVNGWG